MNKIKFCDAQVGDVLRSINDPTLPTIEILKFSKDNEMILYCYNDTRIIAFGHHFYWNLEMELISRN